MFKFKKEKFTEKTEKLKNTIALKRNVYAIVLSVIFIAVVIGLTALSTVLADRYPLEIDLTANKQHSISDKNFEYISSVKEKINVYVACTEAQYLSKTNSTADMGYFAATEYFVDYNANNMVYYTQTVELLKKYQSYNNNINIQFIDVYDAKTREITDNFADFEYETCDILVETTFTLNGKEVTRRAVVPFKDVYTLEDTGGNADYLTGDGQMYQMYGYTATAGAGYGYFITENKIEAAISSAIYRVTSAETPLFLVPTTISSDEILTEALEKILQINNIDLEFNDKLLSTVLTPESYDKYAGIILVDCKSDISADERGLIENFLHNNGKKEKALYYFAGTNTMSLKNLCGLLGDWGIGFEEGVLYETDTQYHASSDNTQIALETVETDYTEGTSETGKICIARNIVYMKQLWPTSTTATYTRTAEVIMRTASLGYTTVMPLGVDIKDWKPAEGAEKTKFPTAIFSHDDDVYEKKYVSSYIVAFAASELISGSYNQNSVANMDITLSTFKEVVGTADSAFSFIPKTIKVEDYYDKVNQKKVDIMKWIFMAAVPLTVIVLGTVVWIRRKSK